MMADVCADIWSEEPKRWEYGELKLERIMTKTFGLYRAFEIDEFHKKLKAHIKWLNDYIDARQLIVNQFAYHDEKYWWKGMDLDEMQRKADIFDEWEAGRCGYFKPGYGCDSPTGIGNSVMCRKLPNCEVLTEESLWKQVKAARDKLYEDLPTGDVDPFALLKVVQAHIATLDEVLEDL